MYNSKLHGLIRNSGLTQREFAEKMSLHPTQISLIITGDIKRTGWSEETIKEKQEQIAAYFKMPASKLF